MTSKAIAYRREAQQILAGLHEPQLRTARDFLTYLCLTGQDDPTLEILADKGLMHDIRTARRDLAQGGRSKLTLWEKLKPHV